MHSSDLYIYPGPFRKMNHIDLYLREKCETHIFLPQVIVGVYLINLTKPLTGSPGIPIGDSE
jgi:hypothetical protein